MIKRALRSAPGDFGATDALFGLYARTGRSDEAKDVLEAFTNDERLTQSQRALIRAKGQLYLEDPAAAQRTLREAIEEDPDSLGLNLLLAAVLLRDDDRQGLGEAEEVARTQRPAARP